jgi:hypothetical protein
MTDSRSINQKKLYTTKFPVLYKSTLYSFSKGPETMYHRLSLMMCCLFALAACAGVKGEAKYPTGADRGATGNNIYEKPKGIFGDGGLSFGGRQDAGENTGIGVNAYLWRASLDTVSFMPLASADPFGGVILTDWYTNPDTPNDRVKLNVFILDKKLTANGVSVKVFRQSRGKGGWVDAKTAPETARSLEDAILTRARQMKVAEKGDE